MTMKTYLPLALLITVLAGNAYGEDEVYYCAEIGNNGFLFDNNLEKYKPQLFNESKFKIGFDRTAKTVEIKGHPLGGSANGAYPCILPLPRTRPELLSCTSSFYHFSFNSDNGRFGLGKLYGYVAGEVNGDRDSISVSYGTCDKF
jgi:hypothetical protein